jgi:hypothetical protein
MYCIKCGAHLADGERACPLCGTVVYHPDLTQEAAAPLYPPDRLPSGKSSAKVLYGAIIILLLIPLVICFLVDLKTDDNLDWFGYVAGACLLAYVTFALPIWFKKYIPQIFIPADFVATALYLAHIDAVTGGGWFLPFALPILLAFCAFVTALFTLLYYIKRGRLYILGGASITLGALMPPLELLLESGFGIPFFGWCLYPLAVLSIFGGLLLYFAINASAREAMERRLFF